VAAPAVPPGDDRADDLVAVHRQDQRVGISQMQRRDGRGGVRRAVRILGRDAPEGQHGIDVMGLRRA
jgi:hypothetical protein